MAVVFSLVSCNAVSYYSLKAQLSTVRIFAGRLDGNTGSPTCVNHARYQTQRVTDLHRLIALASKLSSGTRPGPRPVVVFMASTVSLSGTTFIQRLKLTAADARISFWTKCPAGADDDDRGENSGGVTHSESKSIRMHSDNLSDCKVLLPALERFARNFKS